MSGSLTWTEYIWLVLVPLVGILVVTYLYTKVSDKYVRRILEHDLYIQQELLRFIHEQPAPLDMDTEYEFAKAQLIAHEQKTRELIKQLSTPFYKTRLLLGRAVVK